MLSEAISNLIYYKNIKGHVLEIVGREHPFEKYNR